jgi:hypothetical protein
MNDWALFLQDQTSFGFGKDPATEIAHPDNLIFS